MLGAGAAGLTAALFLRERGRSVVLVDELMGNLMTNIATVENFPGFPAGVPGPEMSALFQQQAILAGAEFLPATATGIEVTWGRADVPRPYDLGAEGRRHRSGVRRLVASPSGR
jgi:thioredoxin reductase (NADPH)